MSNIDTVANVSFNDIFSCTTCGRSIPSKLPSFEMISFKKFLRYYLSKCVANLVNRCKELTSLTISHGLNTRAISLISILITKLGLRNIGRRCKNIRKYIIKSNQIEYASFTSSKILEVSKYHHPSSSEERSSKIKNLILDNCKISDKNLNQLM
uniref:Uncharacterized protein n=1 Tax=Rhizophagus irregularis (strain DAOM 181602 / DAOM 197198 / MUCL 43194) TaxID=747089 RepID=U9SQF1_RHIID